MSINGQMISLFQYPCKNLYPTNDSLQVTEFGAIHKQQQKICNWKIVISEHRTNKRGFYVVLLLSIVETSNKNKNGLPTEAEIVKDQPFTGYTI